MKARLVLCLVTAGLMLASAKSYSLDLFHAATVGNTELKAGEYQVQVIDQKAVITQGKLRVEARFPWGLPRRSINEHRW